jgi:hypothetical protein
MGGGKGEWWGRDRRGETYLMTLPAFFDEFVAWLHFEVLIWLVWLGEDIYIITVEGNERRGRTEGIL